MTTNDQLLALALINVETDQALAAVTATAQLSTILPALPALAPVSASSLTSLVTTARTYLRPFTHADLALLQALHSDPQVMRYFHSGPRSNADSARHLQELTTHQAAYQFSSWAVFSRGDDEFIGRAGPLVWPETGEVEIGYVLHQKFWGLGLGTELARALVAWVFENVTTTQIIAVTMPENLASRRVLEKAGLQLRQVLEINGYPAVKYGITRGEYETNEVTLAAYPSIPS